MEDKMTNTGIMFLVTSSIFGVTGLILPRIAADIAGVDSIVMIPIAGLMGMIFLYFTTKLSTEYPSKIVIEYAQDILGSFIGKIYALVLTLYMLSVSGMILRIFADAIKGVMLPQTPLEIIIIAMIFTSIYLIMNGISSISKVCEIFIPIIILVSVTLIFLPLKHFDVEEFYPLFSKGVKPILLGIPAIFTAFSGFEIIMFITPFTDKKNNILKYGMWGIIIPICIYTLQVITVIGVLGLDTTKFSVYPTLEVARFINFPGAFAERFDIFFIIFWVLASFSTFSCYFYMSTLCVTKLMGLKQYKPFVLIIVPVIFLVSIIPQNLQKIFQYSKYVGYTSISIISFNIVLYLIHMIKKRRSTN